MYSNAFTKIIKKAILVILLFSFIMMSPININCQNTFKESQTQLLYRVSNIKEAKVLENDYNLKILNISPSNVVTFDTTANTDIDLLLDLGFAYNRISFAEKIIWPIKKDPYISQQYALEMMQTIEAWNITTGNADVMVAIIDTGIDITHQEFQGRISNLSYNAVTEVVGIDAVVDDEGHGTMVAGVIGANKDNSVGIAGIAQNVELLIIKANIENEGKFNDSALIEGIYYAIDQGADIINLSLGGPYANPQTKLAVDYARDQGVVVVAAAGNEGTSNLNYPAAFDSPLSVSAVDKTKVLANYSNYGSTISIAAPGSDIISTTVGGNYNTASGTSLAAPQISGVLALIKSYFPNLTYNQLINRLLLSAEDVGPEGKDDSFGYGIVNTYNALTHEFVTISFETFGGSSIEPITIRKNSELAHPENPILTDYNFEGWYKNPELTEPWVDGEIITNDITLYAKYHKNYHTINFITRGEPISPMIVKHGETFILPKSSLEEHTFLGWTLDEENQIIYEPTIVLNDITLYAHFKPIPYYQVTLWVDGEIYEIVSVKEDEIFSTTSLNKIGYTFSGWYIDSDYKTAYSSTSVTSDINLYSKFNIKTFTVTYYNADGESILMSASVNYGSSIDAPQGPKKEPTKIYDYSFEKWSKPSNNVSSDLNIYPIYRQELKPRIVMMQPGVDTIKENEKWIDAGILINDDSLSFIVESKVNTEQTGRYLVSYNIYDDELLINKMIRVVNVIPSEPTITITLNKGITTIPAGEKYVDSGAVSNIGTVHTTSNVDTSKPGVYQVKYHVEVTNKIYQKTRFVHVFEPISLTQTIKVEYKKKENYYNVA